MTHRYQHQEVLSGDQSYEITGYNYRSHLWHSTVKSGVSNVHPPVKDMQQFCQWQFVNRKEMAKRVADAIFASAEKSHDETMRAEVGERALKHAMEKGTL